MAEIKFLPVCSNCGTVLFDNEIDYEPPEQLYYNKNPLRAPLSIGDITPNFCPSCKDRFIRIVMPTRLPFHCERSINDD